MEKRNFNPSVIIAVVLCKECWSQEDHRCVKNAKLGIYEAYLCVAMPALTMTLEAEDLGIGSCLLTPEPAEASKTLKLRKGDGVPLLVGLGYERKGAFQPKRERKSLKELVSGEYMGGKITI